MQNHDLRVSIRLRTDLQQFQPFFAENRQMDKLYQEASRFAHLFNQAVETHPEWEYLSPADLNASVLLHLLYQTVLDTYLRTTNPPFFHATSSHLDGPARSALAFYAKEFPSPLLTEHHPEPAEFTDESLRGFFVHRVMQVNPALVKAIRPLIAPRGLTFPPETTNLIRILEQDVSGGQPMEVGTRKMNLFAFLTEPARLHPTDLLAQISFILDKWGALVPETIKTLLFKAMTIMREEHKPRFIGGGPAPTNVPDYSALDGDYEAFSQDRNWMPNVVMMAKSTLVWLDQLSKLYQKPITTLDQIPDEELDLLKRRGFTALWLIGLWERSTASKKIKNLCGNPDAEASAYSLDDYEISPAIGGWNALENLRERCRVRGIRLASDMVPNHTGIDSRWVMEHPEYFIQQDYPPFPSYSYNGPDLSSNPDIEIKLEDHYYNRTDAAVTFRRRDKRTGQTTYIFHGNDGTSMPWNDTAQLDFLNPVTREAVYQEIRHVAQNFPIIRFDAAMTLAKKHIRRLWYPQLGAGGDIAGRANASMSDAEFNARIPKEFWREVVDRLAQELPDTLLLAEAFWMMEGYFVRTLGMHRVYNSAFMNMLKNQENKKYRDTIKQTIGFDPEILKRFVNFMNNPDEETAIAQFGDGDKYFGVCTLLSTMPGLPMFGHGQLEGYREKYGMEYRRAYWDEQPNQGLLSEHERRIFPLLRKRYLFSGCDHFQLFDLVGPFGKVEESAYCYTNGTDEERSLVLFNNQYEAVEGTIFQSADKLVRHGQERMAEQVSIAQALGVHDESDRYLVYTQFPEMLTYIRPSCDICRHGCSFHLNGYQTIVFIRVHEVADTDGTYRTLCETLGGKGVPNLEEEIAMLRLRPLHKLFRSLTASPFIHSITRALDGEESAIRAAAIDLTECYRELTHYALAMPDEVFRYVRVPVANLASKTVLNLLDRQFTPFAKAEGIERHIAQIMPELPYAMIASFIIEPLTNDVQSVQEAMALADRILLNRLLAPVLEPLGYSRDEIRGICHMGAILAVSGRLTTQREAGKMLEEMMKDHSLWLFAGCNSYHGVTYYRKESMQDLLVLQTLSLERAGDMSAVALLRQLLAKESTANYRLDAMQN